MCIRDSPCTAAEASVGGGANLDTLESVVRILHAMKDHGYQVEHIPENGDELIKTIMERKAISDFRWTTAKEIANKGGVLCRITKDMYMEWFDELPEKAKNSMIDAWGEPIGEAMVYEDSILVTGVSFQNALAVSYTHLCDWSNDRWKLAGNVCRCTDFNNFIIFFGSALLFNLFFWDYVA